MQKAIFATGRRKRASARVFISRSEGDSAKIIINGREFQEYFPLPTTQIVVKQPLVITESENNYNFKVTVKGGGTSGQAGAVRHAIARALLKTNSEFKKALSKGGYLTRDSREVERKKPGRHKARKSPQFSKR